MSLRHKFFLFIFILLFTGIVFWLLIFWQNQKNKAVNTTIQLFDSIEHCTTTLLILSQELFLHPGEKRPQLQWLKKNQELNDILNNVSFQKVKTYKKKIQLMQTYQKKLKTLYIQATRFWENTLYRNPESDLMLEQQHRILGSISLTIHDIYSTAKILSTQLRNEQEQSQSHVMWIIMVLLPALIMVFVFLSIWLAKSINVPLNELKKGVHAVSTGNLDYKINIQTRDELGLFSRAFDTMVFKLKNTMTSRDELERIVKKRSQALKNSRKAAMSVMQDAQMQKKRAEQALARLEFSMAEVRRLNHQIEYVLGATKTGMCIFDAEMKIRYIDPEWQKIYGDPVGKTYGEYFLDDPILPLDHPVLDAFAHKKTTVFEKTLPRENNRPVLATAAPYQDGTGQWLVAEVNVDLSRIKQIEAELKLARDEADAANKAKSLFLANMSHELRTPLNAIIGFSQLLSNQEKNEKKVHYIDSIHASGNVLLSLINDILDLSKIEAGKLPLEYSAVDLKEFTTELSLLFAQKSREKGLELILTVDPDIPQRLVLDEKRIRQVCINLLSNAIKFTTQGSVYLEITPAPGSSTNQSSVDLLFMVKDTGKGISEKNQKIVFDAFQQLKQDNKEKETGTGLGLAITKQLVTLMGGEIHLESREGEGATFIVSLPGVEVATGGEDKKDSNNGFQMEKIIFEPATLLIADDIDYNREILIAFLEPYNFEFIEAQNGRESLDLAQAHLPDLILLDMKMPVMDGYRASKELKQNDALSHIPIIAFTADAMKQDEERIAKTCNGYIRKPCGKSDLVRELVKFLPYRIDADLATVPEAPPEGLDNMQIQHRLAALPEEFYKAIEKAASIGYASGLKKIGAKIGKTDPQLAQAIETFADNFDFDQLLKLIHRL